MRTATVNRKTKETDVSVTINLDGSQNSEINTGIGFLDHMLTLFAFHGRFDLKVASKGDLQVDSHHTVEDIGLTLGQAFRKALGQDPVITRFGSSFAPMDESLTRTVVDISGRPHLVFNCKFAMEKVFDLETETVTVAKVGDLETESISEFFKAFVQESRINLHIENLYGDNTHHKIESIFKSFARALAEACREAKGGVPSTKGRL